MDDIFHTIKEFIPPPQKCLPTDLLKGLTAHRRLWILSHPLGVTVLLRGVPADTVFLVQLSVAGQQHRAGARALTSKSLARMSDGGSTPQQYTLPLCPGWPLGAGFNGVT